MATPDNITTGGVMGLLALRALEGAATLLRYLKRGQSRAQKDAELWARLERIERFSEAAADHSASANRKMWRQDHPGNDTPDPTLEPRTVNIRNPLLKKP